MHFKCKTVQPLAFWVTKVFVTYVRLETQPKIFQKLNSERKIKIFGLWENTYHTIFIYGEMLIIEFSYNFLYVWNCMKLYDKKFLIFENCMIRSFGQPGWPLIVNQTARVTHVRGDAEAVKFVRVFQKRTRVDCSYNFINSRREISD